MSKMREFITSLGISPQPTLTVMASCDITLNGSRLSNICNTECHSEQAEFLGVTAKILTKPTYDPMVKSPPPYKGIPPPKLTTTCLQLYNICWAYQDH